MKKILTISLMIYGVLTTALAHSASHHKLVYVNQYDMDGDGNLSIAEFNHARERRYKQTDENNDGIVDENEYVFEYQNRMDKQLAKDRYDQVKQTAVRFKALDKNDNTQMEWQEYQASGVRSFTYYDVNKDGVIDAQDPAPKNTWEKKDHKTKEQLAAEQQNQLRNAKRLLRMPTTHSREGFFTKYDLNEDNIIGQDEFAQRRRQDFERTDEDKNGWLSEQEYIFEYENRLDQQIARTRQASIKQTHVRFAALDQDKNGVMTLAEYQLSGHRSFKRWDTNQDNIVNHTDPAPKSYKHADKKH